MAKTTNVTLVSHTNGSIPMDTHGATPAEVAQREGISLENVEISVNGKTEIATFDLVKEAESTGASPLVSFQKGKVKSG